MSTRLELRWTSGWVAIVCAINLISSSVFADVDQWKFTNATGRNAQDLHLNWEGKVSWPGTGVPNQSPANTFRAAHGNGTAMVGFAQGQTGDGVPAQVPPASVVIDFEYTGQKPVLTEAWWTFTNSTTNMGTDAVRLKATPGKINQWALVPATGDGVLAVTIDRTQSLFQTTSGDDGVATALRFAQFIDSLPFGNVLDLSGNQISYTGLSYSDDMPNVAVQIVHQDSTQPVTLGTVPEPACVAGMSIGVASLTRRRGRRGGVQRRQSSTPPVPN
jgi:hypothetical protein